jgi:hypothetical protein
MARCKDCTCHRRFEDQDQQVKNLTALADFIENLKENNISTTTHLNGTACCTLLGWSIHIFRNQLKDVGTRDWKEITFKLFGHSLFGYETKDPRELARWLRQLAAPESEQIEPEPEPEQIEPEPESKLDPEPELEHTKAEVEEMFRRINGTLKTIGLHPIK